MPKRTYRSATRKARAQKPQINLHLHGGRITVPVINTTFGKLCDVSKAIPADCDCIMVLINSGQGLNAGNPRPVGFIKLTHQLYLEDLEELLKSESIAQIYYPVRWITIVPIRSKEYLDVWVADGD